MVLVVYVTDFAEITDRIHENKSAIGLVWIHVPLMLYLTRVFCSKQTMSGLSAEATFCPLPIKSGVSVM